MKRSRKGLLFGVAAVLAVCLLGAVWFWYRGRARDIPVDRDSAILTVSCIRRENGADTDWSLAQGDIPEDAADALLDCLAGRTMTGGTVAAPETMTVTDPYVYISIWVENKDQSKVRVNLSNQESYSVVEYGEKYYGIVDSAAMLEQVNSVLADYLSK